MNIISPQHRTKHPAGRLALQDSTHGLAPVGTDGIYFGKVTVGRTTDSKGLRTDFGYLHISGNGNIIGEGGGSGGGAKLQWEQGGVGVGMPQHPTAIYIDMRRRDTPDLIVQRDNASTDTVMIEQGFALWLAQREDTFFHDMSFPSYVWYHVLNTSDVSKQMVSPRVGFRSAGASKIYGYKMYPD
jgi:hypothetical protein